MDLEPRSAIYLWPPKLHPLIGVGCLPCAGEFLNDVIMNFFLTYLHRQNLEAHEPGLQEQVHIFSTFFFKRLTGERGIAEVSLSDLGTCHLRSCFHCARLTLVTCIRRILHNLWVSCVCAGF
jgi:hypothetical protein